MNFTPETRWIGGIYPGALPAHMHHNKNYIAPSAVIKAPRVRLAPSGKSRGYKRDAILALVNAHGRQTARHIAEALRFNANTVRGTLQKLFAKKMVTRKLLKIENEHTGILYYSGLPK